MKRLGLSLLAVLAVLAGVSQGGDDWKKNEGFSSKNSWEKVKAVKTLDPNNADQLKFLLKMAKDPAEYWVIRDAVADVLAGKFEAKTLDELKKVLKTGQGGDAEVVATAFGRSKDTDHVDDLIEQLKNAKDWKVKRAAAIALGLLPAKKGVSALIDALDKESKNFMVSIHILEALEKATGEKDKKNAQDWKGWWTGAEPNWEPGKNDAKGDDEDKKSGERIRTVVRGTDLDFRSRGKGRPLLVLPEYGYEKDYFETYLRGLEESNQILYMKLPGVVDFKNPTLENAPGLNQPFYPIDRLVDTLEDLRKELVKQNKLADKSSIAILGHGITCWVAIRYANKYPKSVSRLVLVSTYASDRAFGRDLTAMETAGKTDGNPELEHFAQTLQYVNNQPKYTPQQGDEQVALSKRQFTTYFGNPSDLEIGRIYGPQVEKKINETSGARCAAIERPMGGCFVPQFDMQKENPVSVKTLIVGGAAAFFGNPTDCQEIQSHCDAAVVQIIPGARMPMIEENAKFIDAVKKTLH
ncbi:MAG TPA: HEAT repeat domain-containing protein [Planctomycetota bacterium]|nr:HEAT repeat domain-containing protein [Planctomycetota bacterium]